MAEYIDRTKAYDAVDARIDELRSDKEFNIVKEICISGVNKHIAAIPAADVISVPEGATIGDMIESILPNAQVSPDPYIPSVDIYMGGILMMRVDRNLWNAPYSKEVK